MKMKNMNQVCTVILQPKFPSDKSVYLWSWRLGLIPSRVKPMPLKLIFTAFLLDIGTVRRTSRQVYLLCRWEKHITEFFHLGVIDK